MPSPPATQTHIHIHTLSHTDTPSHHHTHAHTHSHAHTHTIIHTHIHIHTISHTHTQTKGEELPITPEFSKRFAEVYKEIAGQGERVLGFARKYLSLVRGLVWFG